MRSKSERSTELEQCSENTQSRALTAGVIHSETYYVVRFFVLFAIMGLINNLG
jgi:hypothetical protein